MKGPYSYAFEEIRDAILAMEQDDRRQLAALAGAMHAPQPAISASLAAVLGLISRLDTSDRSRLARWCGRYVSRWGQIPVAASQAVSAKGGIVERKTKPPFTSEP